MNSPSLNRRGFLSASVAATSLAGTAAAACPLGFKDTKPEEGGLFFVGSPQQLKEVMKKMPELFDSYHLPAALLKVRLSDDGTTLHFHLDKTAIGSDTLDMHRLPRLWVQEVVLELPGPGGRKERRLVTSEKEILLALLAPGRATHFKGNACSMDALIEHIGVRQNIAAWARRTELQWPDGGPASWNKKYWNRGTPHKHVDLHAAFLDALVYPERYAVGCYTAAKLILSGAILDYYVRVNPSARKAAEVKKALWSDGDPLVHIEPQSVWSFEDDYEPEDMAIPGKVLDTIEPVAPRNFVPGDWMYLWNTDPVSYQKTGYEGSNAIYLGGGRFSDYYNDHGHSFTFEQKLDDVYQWRMGVFSRRRDYEKAAVLSAEQIRALANAPHEGGFLLPWRLVPRKFGLAG